jgi:hypothetical protein
MSTSANEASTTSARLTKTLPNDTPATAAAAEDAGAAEEGPAPAAAAAATEDGEEGPVPADDMVGVLGSSANGDTLVSCR